MLSEFPARWPLFAQGKMLGWLLRVEKEGFRRAVAGLK